MAWIEDLSTYTETTPDSGGRLRAVGWLEAGQLFATGPADSEVVLRLCEFQKPFDSWVRDLDLNGLAEAWFQTHPAQPKRSQRLFLTLFLFSRSRGVMITRGGDGRGRMRY
jgi:hypothetical protein